MSTTQAKIFSLNELLLVLKNLEEKYPTADDTVILQDNKISIGSRVEVPHLDETLTGRVHFLKEMVSVNRDGFKGIMNFDYDKVKNLSVTEKTCIEAEIWNTSNEIKKLKNEIISSTYDFFEFNIEPKATFDLIEIKIRIIDIKRIEKYELYKIVYNYLNKDEILYALISSKAFAKIKPGNYKLDFLLGNLISINKIDGE